MIERAVILAYTNSISREKNNGAMSARSANKFQKEKSLNFVRSMKEEKSRIHLAKLCLATGLILDDKRRILRGEQR